MSNLLDTKEIKQCSKRYQSLAKDAEKLGDKYSKIAAKCYCYSCKKRGNAALVKTQDLHKQCKGCEHEKKVVPLFKEYAKALDERDDFVCDVYAKAIYEALHKKGIYIKTKSKGKVLFDDFFVGPYSKMEKKYKKAMISLYERDGSIKLV